MRYLDEELTRITLKSAGDTRIDHLFRVAEYYARQSQYNLAYYAYHQYIKYCPNGENVKTARERMGKIRPYSKAVYLDGSNEQFTRAYPKGTMIFQRISPARSFT